VSTRGAGQTGSLPAFLKKRIACGNAAGRVRKAVSSLTTICEEGRCPNRSECFASGTATFLIMGPSCTRACGYCSVEKGAVQPLDAREPVRVAEAVRELGLRYAVITSVTRDDLPDGGLDHYVVTVSAIREASPACEIEVLVPDFVQLEDRVGTIDRLLANGIAVFNHNIETVKELFPVVRPQASYEWSLELLSYAARLSSVYGYSVKSGFMVGLGESDAQVQNLLRDLADAGVDIVTIGQYLRPTRAHRPPARYVTPEEFETYAAYAREAGIAHVVSGPFVRSSYHAREVRAAVVSLRGRE